MSGIHLGIWTCPVSTWEYGHVRYPPGNMDVSGIHLGIWTCPVSTWEYGRVQYPPGNMDVSGIQLGICVSLSSVELGKMAYPMSSWQYGCTSHVTFPYSFTYLPTLQYTSAGTYVYTYILSLLWVPCTLPAQCRFTARHKNLY